MLLPLAVLDKAIGNRVLVLLLRGDHEIEGLLRGFDDFMNLILEDCTECLWINDTPSKNPKLNSPQQILLNSNNVAMIIPCGTLEASKSEHVFENIDSEPTKDV